MRYLLTQCFRTTIVMQNIYYIFIIFRKNVLFCLFFHLFLPVTSVLSEEIFLFDIYYSSAVRS